MNVLIVAATNLEITSDKIKRESILITGVGMMNSAIRLTKELIRKRYDLVINIGIAGSFSEEFKRGDVVEVIEDCFSEVGFEDREYFSEFSDFELKTKYKVDPVTSLKKVRAITVNSVHGNANNISRIIARLNPDIESMEGAAIFKVCEEFKVRCMQIRSISNKVEPRDVNNWRMDLAIKNLNVEIEKLLAVL